MKKIFWISSYPKSGNTWVRYVVANYFYNKNRIDSNFDILDTIKKFPSVNILKNIVNENKLIENPYCISEYWNEVQKEITIQSPYNFIFLKNHNALVKINEYELINYIFSLAAIYIVRDPRDILVSYLNYDKTLTKENAIARLTNKNLYCHVSKKDFFDIEVLGSWKFNYISWRDGVSKVPRIIVKYEDLLNNTFNTFQKIISFICDILKLKIDNEQLKFSINQASFKRLQDLEKKLGFSESKNQFFYSGKSNNWRDILDKNDILFIENCFKKEMKELNYI